MEKHTEHISEDFAVSISLYELCKEVMSIMGWWLWEKAGAEPGISRIF